MSDARSRRGLLKKLLIGLGLLGVLFIGAVIAAPFLIDWEKVRVLIEDKGSQALGREVRITGLHVSLLSGVEIEGFRIGPRPNTSQEPLIQAERAVAKYRLLPLLWLQVIIHKVVLVEPKLYVSRNRKGEWSFADLMTSTAPSPEKPPERAKPFVLPISMNVDIIEIANGALMFSDASVKPTMTASVERLNILVKNFNLGGQPTRITLSLEAKVGGHVIPVGLNGGFGIHLNRSLLTLHDLAVTVPGVKAVTNGEIREFQTLPTLEIQERVTVKLSAVWDHFKSFADPEIRRLITPSGDVTVNTTVSGIMKKIKFEGTVSLEKIALTYDGFPDALEGLEGSLKFDEDRVSTSGLRFIALENPFTFTCDIRGLKLAKLQDFNLKKFSPRGRFSLESPKLVLDKFIPAELAGQPGGESATKKAPPPKEPDMRGLVPRGIELEGEVSLREVKARKLTVTDVVLGIKIAKGNLFYTLSSKGYSGAQAAAGVVELTRYPLRHTTDLKLTGVHAGEFVHDAIDSFMEQKDLVKGRLSGTIDMQMKLQGKGVTFPSLEKWLTGSGWFKVAEGKIIEFRFFDSLQEFLGGRLGKVMQLGKKYKLDKKAKLDLLPKDLGFKSLTGSFNISKGTITTPDLVMDPGTGGDLGMTYKGAVTFDMGLKGKMTTRFHPRHTDQLMKTMIFTKDTAGWAVCDWSVSGTVTRPQLLPSTKQLKKKAKAVAKEEVKKQIKKHRPALEKKAKEVGKKLLKKFFK